MVYSHLLPFAIVGQNALRLPGGKDGHISSVVQSTKVGVEKMCSYTGWPKKNAILLITNFKEIRD